MGCFGKNPVSTELLMVNICQSRCNSTFPLPQSIATVYTRV